MAAEVLPLQGHTVAVTRPDNGEDGGGRLGELLRLQGAEVLSVPLIRFVPAPDPQALREGLSDLRGVAWVLITSPQGAAALSGTLESLGPLPLSGVRLAAVGEATARELRAAGLDVAFVPSIATALALGRELPARPGQVALHLTSQLSENTLRGELQARGIAYRRLELYRTEPAVLNAAQRRSLAGVCAVTLASGSAARELAALAGPDLDPRRLRVAAIGEQTAAAARALGFFSVTVAPHPSLEGLVAAAIKAVRS